LALKILEQVPLFEQEAGRQVRNQLRWGRGGEACDMTNAECRRIAEEIAARETPPMVQDVRNAISRVLGARFDSQMTPAQIAEATRFFGNEAGHALFESLFSMDARSFTSLEPALRGLSSRRVELGEEFARRTRHLPRAALPTPPAVPTTPIRLKPPRALAPPAPPPPPAPPRN
jgi:hypothetical protein